MATKKTRTNKTDSFDFEAALAELEGLVVRMEQGEIPLEESLRDFERGIALTRQCQQALKQAEQKVQSLTADQTGLEDFDRDD
ncbi:MAG: exodeoxyribonuclease VII small subunit [Granulosicoccaceae bacterium]|jgi:exodeoxyribonuclease VII small subunit